MQWQTAKLPSLPTEGRAIGYDKELKFTSPCNVDMADHAGRKSVVGFVVVVGLRK